MRKVIKHLKGEEEARRRNGIAPVKNRFVDNLDLTPVATRLCCGGKRRSLNTGQVGRDFDDLVLGALVYFWLVGSNMIEDVEHQGTAACAHLVNDQIMVRKGSMAVVLAKISRDGLAIVGSEQLSGGVPELACVRGLLGIEFVFEFAEARREERVKFELVTDVGEVEGGARSEDDDLFGKVAIVWVIEAVYPKALCQFPRAALEPGIP